MSHDILRFQDPRASLTLRIIQMQNAVDIGLLAMDFNSELFQLTWDKALNAVS
jgi:hypothetical protein